MSPAFLAAVRGSHPTAVEARIVAEYSEGTNPDGIALDVLDGQVDLDGTADVRSTLDLTTIGTWPRRSSDVLALYGSEIFVRRGIRLAGGSVEWVSLGYHRPNKIQQDRPGAPIRIEASDRMAGLVDGRLLRPVQFGSSTTYGTVVEALVTEVYPEAGIDWDDTTNTQTLGRSVIAEQDRHGFLSDLIAAVGKIWYWDHRGRLQIRTPPDPARPVFTINAGEDGVLVDLSRTLTREGVYNVVVASGEGGDTTEPVRAIRADVNPKSPTYIHGRFGPVPRFYSSQFITTKPQAQQAATNMLRQQLGLPYSVDLSMVPNVALEPFDPAQVVTSEGTETHILEKLGIPLTPEGDMSAATREQTVVLIGDA